MAQLKPDLLNIVESLYAVEQPRELWIAGLQKAAAQLFGAGVASVFYDVSGDALSLDAIHAYDVPDEMLAMGRYDHTESEYRTRVRDFYRSVLCESQEVYAGWNREYIERMARHGIHDAVMINGLDPSGLGVVTYLFSAQKIELSDPMRSAFERLAVHIASSYRLLRRLNQLTTPAIDNAAAVFNARGALEDMRKPLAREQVDDLKRALSERDWARGPARTQETRKALASWKALVQGRWTLVDHFERDGSRYVVAQENPPKGPLSTDLSQREWQVAALAALGRSNKVIAYELGIAHSTVRVLIGRACARVGVRTRAELIQWLAELGPRER